MMMINIRKNPKCTIASDNRQPVRPWRGVILLGMLAVLFSFVKIGESAEISKKMIEEIVLTFLSNNIPWDKNRVKVNIIQSSEALFLPDLPYTYEVIPPVRTNYLGNIPLKVVFDVQGHPQQKAWAMVRIGVETDAIVVQKPLIRNQTIEKDDVKIISMDMADLPSNFISSLEDVVGKRTLRVMNPKEVFRTDIVERLPMVKRNDRVSIIAESEALRITAAGEVKESGCRGDRVKVVNLNSNKEIFARVLDPQTVRVEF